MALAVPCLAAKKKKKQSEPPAPAAESQSTNPAPATPAAPPAPPVVSQPVKPGIEGQIDRGKAALASGDMKTATEAFKNALDVDKNNPMALHGLGIAQFGSNDKTKGFATLERALAASDNANRAIVYNLAIANLMPPDNAMRAAKFIKDFLSRPGVAFDEPLQNLLGAALARVGDESRSLASYTQARDFYLQYDVKLAAARHNGMARWGMRWIPEGQAKKKWDQSRSRAQAYEDAKRDAAHANLATKKANEAVYDLNHSLALHSDREQRDVSRNYKQAVNAEKAAVKKRDQAKHTLDATEMPEFPKVLEFIPIDALKPEQSPPQN
jgi:tetratricopeptide (TPR) repeat protein